jgi:hypothetical protein
VVAAYLDQADAESGKVKRAIKHGKTQICVVMARKALCLHLTEAYVIRAMVKTPPTWVGMVSRLVSNVSNP